MATALVRRIPAPVYAETTSGATRVFTDAGEGYDYAIGGLPFNSAATRERPILRRTADARKDQTDVSLEPGEHSLAFWWLRSQASFHGGAGQRYLGSADTNNDDISRYRFWDSEGMDVFSEPGSVTLLPSTSKVVDTAGATPLIATTDIGYLYVAVAAGLTRRWMSPFGSEPDLPTSSMTFHTTTVSWGGVDPILSLTTDGDRYFLATENGVWAGTGTGAATKIYDLPAGSQPLLRYIKQRLILAVWDSTNVSVVYELDPEAAGGSTLPVAVFAATKHWRWTDIAETPSAILISGHNWGRSVVYKMTLDTSGSVPVLGPGVVSVEMPPAEIILGLTTYLGTVVGVQTSRGFRVGVLNDSGDFTYGPLLFEHGWNAEHAAIVGAGNSLYASCTQTSGAVGLARIDLTNTIGSGQSLRFPYAWDLRAVVGGVYPTGAVTQADVWDYGRKVFAVAGVGVFVELQPHTVGSGWLQASRIRWDTLEPKLVRYARVRGEGDYGTVGLELGRNSDVTLTTITTVDLSQRQDSGDVYVPLDPGQFFTAKITLTDGTFSGYQLKAMPAQRRQRLLTLPLACYDREVGNTGQVMGQGSAMSRLLALEDLEQSGEVVTLQWLSVYPDEQLTEYVVVEGIEFDQTAVSSDAYGWGGVIALTLRTVD